MNNYNGTIIEESLDDKSVLKEAKEYGISLGIPKYQVDFHRD